MRITSVAITEIPVSQRGNWLFVSIETDVGLTGWEEASHGGTGPARDSLLRAIVEQQCARILTGKGPRDVRAATVAQSSRRREGSEHSHSPHPSGSTNLAVASDHDGH
ncbi:MAG: hypothetical protein M1118_03980 [Chloroflexi bacterium]|nr:hypothetical protein [Chloroflexota bacterium]